eukprot:m.29306 g.29306  ORF g.29306 m.29306 type:complete len:925 (-) comp13698_c0_seq6:3131-5905(-)
MLARLAALPQRVAGRRLQHVQLRAVQPAHRTIPGLLVQRSLAGSGASAVGAASRNLLVAALRRFLLYPAVVIGGASVGLDSLKEKIPDMPDLGPVQEFAHAIAGHLKQVFDGGHALVEGALQSGAAVADRIERGVDSNAEIPIPKKDGADDELLDELNHLRRQVTALEDSQSDDISEHQREVLQLTEQLQGEIDRLVAENDSLRRRLVLDSTNTNTALGVSQKQTAAEMYSDLLAIREKAESSFASEDHMPRVVVVGDQSAGKTSVLEMVVRARIFPRGAGEMMTRAPVQVTMSDGPQHIAMFKDAPGVYNIDRSSDLALLRDEIERRMRMSVEPGHTVSDATIALDIRGPGLRPMVLVDLPGIIQHHTLGMYEGTKDTIIGMCKRHVENPNAIIMCVQDATRDAEGSSIADVVRSVDPDGKRTLFVLTKVDLAEKMKKSSHQLQRILKGQVFNMNARNYFAVVAGTSDEKTETIESIRHAEKAFFDESELFMTGVVKASSMGTQNLARAVSKVFWETVHKSLSVQIAELSADLKRKENEWKSRYPGVPRMSREELFIVGRHRILEAVHSLNTSLTAMDLEKLLTDELWAKIRGFVFDTLYVRAAEDPEPGSFKTNCENLLEAWVSKDLADSALQVSRSTLIAQMEQAMNFPDADGSFQRLKNTAIQTCATKMSWSPQSRRKLQTLQELKLKDDVVPDSGTWVQATAFMSKVLTEEHRRALTEADAAVGPSYMWQWLSWRRLTPAQRARSAAFSQLSEFFPADKPAKSGLNHEEANGVSLSVSRAIGAEVDAEFIHETYQMMYKIHFLNLSIKSAAYCRTRYGQHERDNKACNNLACTDVLFFWRVLNMLQSSGNMLRVEAMDFKNVIEDELRLALGAIHDDKLALQDTLSSPRMDLAEDIEVVKVTLAKMRAVADKLESEGRV